MSGVSGLGGDENRPSNAEKMVMAAYFRMIGHSQAEAAIAVGRKARTIRRWEAHDWWPTAVYEARERWNLGAEVAARGSVFKGVASDPRLGLELLARLDRTLAKVTSRRGVQVVAESGSRMTVNVVGPRSAGPVPPLHDAGDQDDDDGD